MQPVRITATGYCPCALAFLLGKIVVGLLLARAEAVVALHRRDDLLRGQLVALRLVEYRGWARLAEAA